MTKSAAPPPTKGTAYIFRKYMRSGEWQTSKLSFGSFCLAALYVLGLGLAGCSTQSTEPEKPQVIRMKDLRDSLPYGLSADASVTEKGKQFRFKMDALLVNEKSVRLDLITMQDTPLAAVVFTETKVEYILFRDKKHYTGAPNPRALDPVFPLTVTAADLVRIFREQAPTGTQCEFDNGQVVSCSGQSGGIPYRVTWSKRQIVGAMKNRATKVEIELIKRGVTLRFNFNDVRRNIDNAPRLLTLQVPENFKTLPVPTP